ncbi:MAG: tetratricopeptide repeat protein [Pseudomonadota bacterium]
MLSTLSPIRNAALILAASVIPAMASPAASAAASKDAAPANAACDGLDQGTSAWRNCLATQALAGDDHQLFYAGYWLAKNGRYSEALAVLAKVKTADAAVLTYRGFATRKLGKTHAAVELYEQALALEPENAVTRSYMGEAFLTLGRRDAAKAELDHIASICGGPACTPYRDLERAITQR